MKTKFLLVLCVLSAFFSSCTNVQPWEKETLSKAIMSIDTDPLESKNKQHIYFSKEGSSGGYGLGGGGCGCN